MLCYVDAGASESFRSDAASFPPAVLGKTYERRLDIRRIDLLRPILDARLDRCVARGFDGVDPDNVDGYANDTGFALTPADQLAFDRFVAHEAHARGLAVRLKNDDDQVADLVPSFDFAITEGWWQRGTCAAFAPFVRANEPVFTFEYAPEMTPSAFQSGVCPKARASGDVATLKRRALDAYRVVGP